MSIETTLTDSEFNLEELFNNSLLPQIAIVIDDEVKMTLQLSIEVVAALLSNPKIVLFYRENETTHVKEGIKYIDKKFVFPDNWKLVDGVPTPPTIIT